MCMPEEYHPNQPAEPCDHEAVNAWKLTAALWIGILLGTAGTVAFYEALQHKVPAPEVRP